MDMWYLLLVFILLPDRTSGEEEPRLYPELFITTRKCDISYSSAIREFKECYSDEGSCSSRASRARKCALAFKDIRCPPLEESIARDLANVWSRYALIASATCEISLGVEDFLKCYEERLKPAQNQCRFPPDSALASICRAGGLEHVKRCYLTTAQTCDPEGYKATKVWLNYIVDKVICGKGSGGIDGESSKSSKLSPYTYMLSLLMTMSCIFTYF